MLEVLTEQREEARDRIQVLAEKESLTRAEQHEWEQLVRRNDKLSGDIERLRERQARVEAIQRDLDSGVARTYPGMPGQYLDRGERMSDAQNTALRVLDPHVVAHVGPGARPPGAAAAARPGMGIVLRGVLAQRVHVGVRQVPRARCRGGALLR
jgi:hypothetical protein